MAATPYDANACPIVEVDARAGTHRLLNLDLVDWNTHFLRPCARRSRRPSARPQLTSFGVS
jgi:hypothetical protein